MVALLLPFALFLLTIPALAQKPTCTTPFVRKEFRELIGPGNVLNAEGQTFIDAIKCVTNATGNTGGSLWDDFTTSHSSASAEAHGNARFLPWHRLFLIHMEKAMTDCLGRQVAMPYWDGTLDSQAPENSVIWQHIGGNGNNNGAKGSAACVMDGPHAGVTYRYPTPGCLTRSFGNGDLPAPETVALFAASSQGNYEDWRSRIENTYHASVHIFMGGQMVDLSSSPNDIVFFLHHAFVDKLFADWQNTNEENQYKGNRNAMLNMHSAGRVIGNRRVRDVLRTQDWCYSYSNGVIPLANTPDDDEPDEPDVPEPTLLAPGEIPVTIINPQMSVAIPRTVIGNAAIPMPNLIGSLLKRGFGSVTPNLGHQILEKRAVDHGSPKNTRTPACEDRDDWYNVRRMTKLPESYIAGMGMDVDVVRKYEAEADAFVEWMNTKEHVSICALVNARNRTYRARTDEEVEATRRANAEIVNGYRGKK